MNQAIVKAVRTWMGDEGLLFFRNTKKQHGRVDAVWMDGRIPHAVHFQEGMQVRNCMRGLPECKDWTDHDYDNRWVAIVEEAIKEKETAKPFKPSGKNTNCLEGWVCPECGQENEFYVAAQVLVSVTDDGTNPYIKGGGTTEWDDGSFCECVECHHQGSVGSFNGS